MPRRQHKIQCLETTNHQLEPTVNERKIIHLNKLHDIENKKKIFKLNLLE